MPARHLATPGAIAAGLACAIVGCVGEPEARAVLARERITITTLVEAQRDVTAASYAFTGTDATGRLCTGSVTVRVTGPGATTSTLNQTCRLPDDRPSLLRACELGDIEACGRAGDLARGE